MGKQWLTLFFLGSQITADGDCSLEIKRRLLLGRKVMTNLDSILKSRDITLPTKVRLVKAMVVPLVMYGCESWIVKKSWAPKNRWLHWLGHGFGWTPGVGDGQGGLACCGSWGHKESDRTEWLSWTDWLKTQMVIEYFKHCPRLIKYFPVSLKNCTDVTDLWKSLKFFEV